MPLSPLCVGESQRLSETAPPTSPTNSGKLGPKIVSAKKSSQTKKKKTTVVRPSEATALRASEATALRASEATALWASEATALWASEATALRASEATALRAGPEIEEPSSDDSAFETVKKSKISGKKRNLEETFVFCKEEEEDPSEEIDEFGFKKRKTDPKEVSMCRTYLKFVRQPGVNPATVLSNGQTASEFAWFHILNTQLTRAKRPRTTNSKVSFPTETPY